jgi:hypothetical protein
MRAIAAPGCEAPRLMDYATEYAIRHLIHRSADLQDRGQVEEVAQLFQHGEIVFAGVGQVFVGVDGVRDMLRRNVFYDANGLPADPSLVYATTRALHYVTSVDVSLDAGGAPCATSRFLIIQQHERSPRIVIGGRYLDSFAQVGDGFEFRRRIVEVHIVGDSVGYLTANPWSA